MKYVLLFCRSDEDAAAFAAMTPDELRARYEQVGAWFTEHRKRIGGTNYLQGPETATSVRFGPDGPPVVTDGPYLEGKESIGGYAEIEVADLGRCHLYHATRAELLRELARPAQARQADERALGLTGNPAERALLEQRLA